MGRRVIDQIIGTALLLMLILAITDKRNQAVEANLAPFVIGLLVVVIGMAMGGNAGYAINPARDLGPRLLSTVGGWGGAPFSYSVDWPTLLSCTDHWPIDRRGGGCAWFMTSAFTSSWLHAANQRLTSTVRGEAVIDKPMAADQPAR